MSNRRPQSNQLRRGRVNGANPTLITCCCVDRQPLLSRCDVADTVLECLLWLDNAHRMDLHVAVVMPDHVHFVATLQDGTWAALMHGFKGFTAHRINRLLTRDGALWQTQYQDRAIRSDHEFESAIRYCLNNPLRRELVLDYRDYPHWYCRYEIQ
jgi:putative transposase